MKKLKICTVLLLVMLVVGCSTNPYRKTNRIHERQAKQYAKTLKEFPPTDAQEKNSLNFGPYWVGTTNFSLRKPNYVILHHTAQNSVDHTLKTFTLPRTAVSSHYVIGRNGEIYQMLNDYYRAWHAGTGSWGNNTDLNSSSIGIELDNNGFEPFAEEQISSLLELLEILKEKYSIPTKNFIGHSDIAPSRKVDPNATFPWKRLAEEGFGLWYDNDILMPEVILDGQLPKAIKIEARDSLAGEKNLQDSLSQEDYPERIDPKIALKIIGYDVNDLDAAIRAFKLHFIQEDISSELTEKDLNILYNLYRKYL